MKESPQRAPDKKAHRSEPSRAPAPLESPLGLTQDALGNRGTLALLRSARLQRKARVSQRGDPLEHDADRAADAVVSEMPVSAIHRAAATDVQRMGTEEQALATALGLGPAPADAVAPAALDEGPPVDAGEKFLYGGEPLDEQTRGVMESRFGESFRDVRVHTGQRAAETAAALEAYAFTVGDDIVFGEGQFAPETTEGRRLLAHELAHVVQQRSPTEAPAPEATTEAEAELAAHGAEFGGPIAVESRADRGEIQRQSSRGTKTVPGSRVAHRTVFVDEMPMAHMRGADTLTKTGQSWDPDKKVYGVSTAVGGFFINRGTRWDKAPGADANAGDKTIVISGTDKNGTVESITVNAKGSTKPKQPKPQPPAQPPEGPKDQPPQEQKDEKPAETKPSSVGRDKVDKVEKKSKSDPNGALQDAGDLSPAELNSVGPGTRKNLLDAAAKAPRDSNNPQLARDLITTTPDRDAGAVSDALQADGGKLLDDLKDKADSQTAAALDAAASDLAARRIDAPEPDAGKDIVELTPELKKKTDEIRELLKKMGRRTHGLDEVREGQEDWPVVKAGLEQNFERELRNLDRDVKRWNDEHEVLGGQADSASDIAAAARDEANKAFEKMRSAKTERELYAGWKAATHAIWRANQMMDAKRDLDRFESSVRAWNETQSGWAALAAVPSHALAGTSRDRPNEIAAQARTDVNAALAQLRDAQTREEKIQAATRLKQVLANANHALSAHQDEVYEGADRVIIGVEVVAATTVIILAPEVAIPGMLVGGGLGAAHEGALMIDDPNHQFSGRAVFDTAAGGAVVAPLAAGSSVVAYVVLPGLGVYGASQDFEKEHYVAGTLGLVTAVAPIGIKGATGKGPPLPSSRPFRATTFALVLRASSEGIENVPGLGGRNPSASIPRGPEVAWVTESPGTSARTPGGIVIPGETSVAPDVTPGFDFGVPSPKPPAPTWATVQPGSDAPTSIPFTVSIGQQATGGSTAAPAPAPLGVEKGLERASRVRDLVDAEVGAVLETSDGAVIEGSSSTVVEPRPPGASAHYKHAEIDVLIEGTKNGRLSGRSAVLYVSEHPCAGACLTTHFRGNIVQVFERSGMTSLTIHSPEATIVLERSPTGTAVVTSYSVR